MSTSSKQTQANKKWEEKNKEYAYYLKVRSTAKGFIRNKATEEDLHELISIINEKLDKIKESKDLDKTDKTTDTN